uniref:Rab GTPase-activating protein 1-like, isoform 10 n=1 Tax=Stegastes partitus TaxID=144197 RepID=A0A3B5AIQ2_9TELE
MMEEMSMAMAYDANAFDQMSEEEILACLVSETEPKNTVRSTFAWVTFKMLQFAFTDPDGLFFLCGLQKENRRLQQTSHRLEQENDNLAHRLISSKVALRNALDKAEDRVDELTKDLLQTRHRLQATEEEKKGKEEETVMLKEVFRRELEKAEQEVKRSSGIIADYKQICSQLTNRLEKQQAAHREELDSLKVRGALSLCSSAVICPTFSLLLPPPCFQRIEDREKESLRTQIRELEQELVQTKLQMVEAKCKIQELEHQKGILSNDLQESKNNWISKAFTSLRTSSGGLHGISIPKDGAASGGWSLHGASLSGWSAKKLSWPHRDNREKV